jgi:hypothetical protein
MVYGLGFGVCGLELRVKSVGFRFKGLQLIGSELIRVVNNLGLKDLGSRGQDYRVQD